MEDNKYFIVPPWVIGSAKVLNSVLLVLAGYSFAKEEGVVAILIAAGYAGCKTFVEIAKPRPS